MSPSGLPIVLADDHVDFVWTLEELLRLRGFAKVMTAMDGDAALALVRKYRPPVAILDLGMPGLDGCRVAALARALDPHIALVCVTGYGDSQRMQQAREAGFDLYLLKGADLNALFCLLNDAARRFGRQ